MSLQDRIAKLTRYSAVIELGIFLSHGIWLLRTRSERSLAKALGHRVDDLSERSVTIDKPEAAFISKREGSTIEEV